MLHVMHSWPSRLADGCISFVQAVHAPVVTNFEELIEGRRSPCMILRLRDALRIRDTPESAPSADAMSTIMNADANAKVNARPSAVRSNARYTYAPTSNDTSTNANARPLVRHLKSLHTVQ